MTNIFINNVFITNIFNTNNVNIRNYVSSTTFTNFVTYVNTQVGTPGGAAIIVGGNNGAEGGANNAVGDILGGNIG